MNSNVPPEIDVHHACWAPDNKCSRLSPICRARLVAGVGTVFESSERSAPAGRIPGSSRSSKLRSEHWSHSNHSKKNCKPIFFYKRVKMKFLHLAINGNLSPVVTCGHLWSPVVTCVAPWIVAAPQAWPGPLRRCFVQRPGCRDFPCWTCAGMIHAPQHSWRHRFFRRFREVPGGSQGKCPNRPRISDGDDSPDDCSVRLSGETLSGGCFVFWFTKMLRLGWRLLYSPKKLYMENVGPPDAIQRDLSWAKTINPHDIRKWQRMGPSWSDIVTGSTHPSQENDSLILECGGCSVCQHHK